VPRPITNPRTEPKTPYLDRTLPLVGGFGQRPEDHPMSCVRHSMFTPGSPYLPVTRILTNPSKAQTKRARVVPSGRTSSRTHYPNGSKGNNERYKTNRNSNNKIRMSNRANRTDKTGANRSSRTKARTARSPLMPIPPIPRVHKTSNIIDGGLPKAKITKPATMVVMAGEMMKVHKIINTALGRARTMTVGAAMSTMIKEG
jgi:hypothetical protein